MSTELAKWDNAKNAIAECRTIDEVKEIRDKAEAMRAYAKQAKESLVVQNDLCEIKLRAERRAGEMLRNDKEFQEFHPVRGNTMSPLKSVGIEKHESSRWQKIANIPESKFEEIITDTKQKQQELTESMMLRVEKEIHKKHTAPPPPLPQKKYEVVYADPPWIYNSSSNLADASTITANGGKHYAGMTIEQMCDIGVKDIIADNAILFIWTTGPNMKNTFPIIDAWGFEFCTVAFVWDKQKINPGNYTISQCEFVLLGKHGKIPEPRGARDIRQFLSQERGKHSEKPQEIRHRIEQMFPKQKRLEMFARDKFVGWDVWGDEA